MTNNKVIIGIFVILTIAGSTIFIIGEGTVEDFVKNDTAVPENKITALDATMYNDWDFDFEALVATDTIVKAIAEEAPFNITFQIEDKTDVTQKSDSLTVPTTYREGYEFQGWVVEGTSAYVEPDKYTYTADMTFVAMYKQIGFSKVTFIIGETSTEISVKNGTPVPADKVPTLDSAVYSGWDKDIGMNIDADTVFTAVLVAYHKVIFNFGAEFSALNVTVEVADGALIDKEKIPAIPLQMGDVMWSMDFDAPVTSDVTTTLIPVVYPEEPGFFETTSGRIVIVILGAVALAVAPASPMNYKLVKGKLDAAKAAKEAKKKP